MDAELKELYQEIILDHNKNPKNFRKIEPASHQAQGYNPLCGDRIDVYLNVEGDRIAEIGFQGSGCAISKASASVMTTVLQDRTLDETKALFKRFIALLTVQNESEIDSAELDKLAVFAGVREYPTRVKCATLAWHTLMAALDPNQEQKVVSTE